MDDAVDIEDLKAAMKDPIQRVFAVDHDFYCISRHRDEAYDNEFKTGVEYYLDGDWPLAKLHFQMCEEKMDIKKEVSFTHDGPLKRLMNMIEIAKLSPEDWNHT